VEGRRGDEREKWSGRLGEERERGKEGRQIEVEE